MFSCTKARTASRIISWSGVNSMGASGPTTGLHLPDGAEIQAKKAVSQRPPMGCSY
jgi:hypothetical protein